MKLFYTASSPFVRKVLVAAHELGVAGRIETTFLRPSPTKADAELSASNPLAKIPALVTDDGATLYDSRVICEHLATLAKDPHALVPASGSARFDVLRRQALADGILDAGILVRYEEVERPKELTWPAWVAGQTAKINQGLDALDREAPGFGDRVDLGIIAAAVAVGWLEFRNPIGDVRGKRHALTEWYLRFCERPSMRATVPKA